MKWFISIVPDFNDILGVYREIHKKPQSLVTQVLHLQVFEDLIFSRFSGSPHLSPFLLCGECVPGETQH